MREPWPPVVRLLGENGGLDEARLAVLRFALVNGCVTPKEAATIAGLGYDAARRVLAAMVGDGWLRRLYRGCYVPGPRVYTALLEACGVGRSA